MMKNLRYLLLALCLCASCGKTFLEKRSDKGLLVPSTLADFRALLDNLSVMNVAPTLPRISADLFYTNENGYNQYSTLERNCYIWAEDLYEGKGTGDWNYPYRQLFYANIVLDGLEKLGPDLKQSDDYREVKGAALFHRALAVLHLSQIFVKPYVEENADTDLGLPIPLTADVNERPDRGTLKQTYRQMISDFDAAATLLPGQTLYKSRPSAMAVFAYLSRVYLIMGNYDKCDEYAEKVLSGHLQLLDYNEVDITASSPFPAALSNDNTEVIFHSVTSAYIFSQSGLTGFEQTFYDSFEENDLRKALFFRLTSSNVIRPKNGYGSPLGTFAGIALDEIYLNRAECLARKGELVKAAAYLDELLSKRWQAGTYHPAIIDNRQDLLRLILDERKKELLTHATMRWTDLRRLNLEEPFAVTITRTLEGKVYTLPPNDPRYTFPIPPNELEGNDLEQNTR